MCPIKFFLFFFLLLFFCGCLGIESPSSFPGYIHTTTQITQKGAPSIPIYLDIRFNHEQRQVIEMAIMEWNYALNGELKLVLSDIAYLENSDRGKAIREEIRLSNLGLIIYCCPEGDPILKNFYDDGHLAFVNDIGERAHLMVIMASRMVKYDWKSVIMHELGHALGAVHVNTESLMFPISSPMMISCADKISVFQVGTYHHLNISKMRYCRIHGFE